MLMVVFGAGASYDSVPARLPAEWPPARLPERPPLADELFEDRPVFADGIGKFAACKPIIPLLQQRSKDVSVEQVLERLLADANDYPGLHRQLAALRYYLHFVIWRTELLWDQDVARGITNYKTFLGQLERWRRPEERICLVTFNYDRLLESALSSVGVQIGELTDYVSRYPYKVIKLHGSVNWGREVNTPIENLEERHCWSIADELIERTRDLDISKRYRMVLEYPVGKTERSALYPAIAIPVESEKEYECPDEHREVLLGCIPEITRLIVVGWRARDSSFVRLLAENLRGEVEGVVVAGGVKQATEVIETLQHAGVKAVFRPAGAGFSEFAVNREADQLLQW